MQYALAKLEHSKVSCTEEIETAAAKSCKAGWNWFTSVLELLFLNPIDPVKFSSAIRTMLIKRHRKCNNILLTGSSNSGKTFHLKPSDKVSVKLLQDFMWNKDSVERSLVTIGGGTYLAACTKKSTCRGCSNRLRCCYICHQQVTNYIQKSFNNFGPTRRCLGG